MPTDITEEMTVSDETAGLRLDKLLSLAFPDYSRSFLKDAIRREQVTVGGQSRKPSYAVRAGDAIRVCLPVLVEAKLAPEPIPIEVLFEDGDMLAVNKPPDLVVHPTSGHSRGTLANALLHYCQGRLSDLNGPLRPGIVHRLDRDTSGVILCAKTNLAHHKLAEQFQLRQVHKTYLAVVRGVMAHDSGEVGLPIGRDPRMRERMSVRAPVSRPALSRWYLQERFAIPKATGKGEGFSLVHVEPVTGRTHQVRVHMSSLGHPVACDALYGGGEALYPSDLLGGKKGKRDEGETPLITRQALHALDIRFTHPITGAAMHLHAEPPEDIQALLAALRKRTGSE